MYDLLRERLLEGHYPAGTRLPTDDLRLELGVSKQPVMEALRRLAADGMIEIVPQVGCLVTGYDLHEIEDFYLGFGGFEGSIAGIAALRRTDEQLAELDDISGPDRCTAQPNPMPPSAPAATACGTAASTTPSAPWRSHG